MKRLLSIFMIAVTLACIAMSAQNTTPSMDTKFIISANGKEMTATFADNSSAEAFRSLISDAPLTVEMSDYGDFEKVGPIGCDLPVNDSRITTRPGDVILYLGNNITIYYDENTWTFTRLGKIDGNPTRESILSMLGNGNVNVTFSLKNDHAGRPDIDAGSHTPEVRVSGKTVTIEGCGDDTPVSVHDVDGKCVYQGHGREITLPAPGIYVVACGGTKAKIMAR